jgi:hypothetical protein
MTVISGKDFKRDSSEHEQLSTQPNFIPLCVSSVYLITRVVPKITSITGLHAIVLFIVEYGM